MFSVIYIPTSCKVEILKEEAPQKQIKQRVVSSVQSMGHMVKKVVSKAVSKVYKKGKAPKIRVRKDKINNTDVVALKKSKVA